MLFCRNFHILALFRKFEIGREIVKNYALTPLLFGEIFRPQKLSKIWVWSPWDKGKSMLFGRNFHILGLFRILKLVEKSSKTMG